MGFQRYSGSASEVEVLVDGGHLAGLNIMFTLYEDEWCHFKVAKFIPEAERDNKVFTYEVRIGKGKGHLPVFFDIQKYNENVDVGAELASWFLIELAN